MASVSVFDVWLINEACVVEVYNYSIQIIEMCDLIEVAFTSDASGSLWSCCAWDPRTGTQLQAYKGERSFVLNFELFGQVLRRYNPFRWRCGKWSYFRYHQK